MAIDYNEWRAGAARRRAAVEPFLIGVENDQRSRPRSASEAKFLRSLGTPERKIGPTRPDEAN